MKWSKFIQDDNKLLKESSQASRLNTSRSRINSSGNELALKSIEKAKADTTFHLNKNMSTSSIQESELKMNHLVSKYSYRPPKKQFLEEFESSPNFNVNTKSKVDQIIERFSRELSDFIKNFMEKIDAMRNSQQIRQAIYNRITSSTEDIFAKCMEQLPKMDLRSTPLRKSLSCIENSKFATNKQGINMASEKKKARVLLFKNEKVVEKNNFNRIESTFHQMNRLLENERQPKFMRTSKAKKTDRSGDSSVEEVLERSLYDSKKSYKSKLKSKDALYNINKILNQ